MQEKVYDIGLVCAANLNIGNNLTNYALYQYLCDLDHEVLVICNPLDLPPGVSDSINDRFRLFLQLPYPEGAVFIPEKSKLQLSYANLVCDRFVLGSDQLWRDIFLKETDFFTCLDWAESRKYKIAYATSFGRDRFEGNANMQEKMGYLLRRFQDISVREQGGVKLLKELYEIEAECVLDPVFLCEKKHYVNMAERGKLRLPEGKYVGAYLLDITEQKEKAVEEAAAYLSGGIYRAVTQPYEKRAKSSKLSFLSDPRIEEWLAMIQNCDFFLTDSFHGACFAILFQKQFCIIFDKENWRGLSRIQSLLDLLQLSDRLTEPCNRKEILGLCDKKIDYDQVYRLLSVQRRKSETWLKHSLEKANSYKGEYDLHDYVQEMCRKWKQEILDLQRELFLMNERTRNDLFLSQYMSVKTRTWEAKEETGAAQVVGWGAGECFKRNIHIIKRFCDMRYVCDQDRKKWGEELDGQVVCISPGQLSEMSSVVVIIMVDRAAAACAIARELLEMGIKSFEHVENWLAFVRRR